MTAITKAALAQRIRYEANDHPWEDTGAAANATSTITGVTTAFWVKGDIGEFAADGDTFYTQSEAAGTITAVRSYNGSTGATHAAASRIFKNPRYTLTEINNAVEGVIQDLPFPQTYKAVLDSVTPAPTTTVWYDLAAPARRLIKVVQPFGPGDALLGFYGVRHAAPRVIFERNLPTAQVTSLAGLMFPDGFYHESNVVAVTYAAKITDTGTTSWDDLQEGDNITEAVVYGAVARLEAALEQKKPRKPRQDRETLRGASLYERKYQQALNRARQELRATVPLMGTRTV